MKLKEFSIMVPVSGYMEYIVMGESEEEAIKYLSENIEGTKPTHESLGMVHPCEWEVVET